MKTFVLMIFGSIAAAQSPVANRQPPQRSNQLATQEAAAMDSLTGKTIAWVFEDGPMAKVNIQHVFHADGSVTWRIVDGPHKGASVREKRYAAYKVNAKTWVISYLAASGHTLTVVLNLEDGRMVGFGSNQTAWEAVHGRFEFVP